jgi:hypothetical protein
MHRLKGRLTLVGLAATVACFSAWAEAPVENEPFTPQFSLSAGVEVVSSYFFRGIPQENQGAIVQPYVTPAVTIYKSADGWLNEITLSVTSWNSIHSGPSGDVGDPQGWYESDAVGTVTAKVFGDWTVSLNYAAYLSPNGAYNTYQEIYVGLSYDDSKLLGKFALRPRAVLAVEIDDQADAGNSAFESIGTNEGVFLELGIAPQIDLVERSEGNVALAFPITLGLSLDDYYETADGDGETFGFVDVGAELVVPLDLPGAGSWTIRAGPHAIWMGDNAAEIGSGIGGGDEFDVWVKVGISVTF